MARGVDVLFDMNRILVGLDTSALSTLVLRRAVDLARNTDGTIVLLRAIDADPTSAPTAADAAREELRDREHAIPPELRGGIAVEIGKPSDVIRSAARAYDTDVVVIGAHRHGLFARMLGTTAAEVVNGIDRPVIVVRPTGGEATEEIPRSLRHDEHVMLETATLVGAATGAAAGAIAGPPGAIVGGMLGTAIGMITGQTMDKQAAKADAHDRRLDEEIGVASADLGARETAKAALDALDRAAGTGGYVVDLAGGRRAGAILRRDHERLEKLYDAFLASYVTGDWNAVRAQWELFEPALRQHIDTEEQVVFPEFEAVDAAETRVLAADHAELRRLLGTLGVAIDLHALPQRDAQELVARLRAHGAREEVLLYPWMDRSLDAGVVRSLDSAA